MKHFYIFASMLAAALTVQAQQSYDIRLTQLASEDEAEIEEFTYNSRGLMETRSYVNYLASLYLIDTNTYNELGQLVSISTKQDLSYSYDPDQMIPIYRIDYQYDEKGRIIMRENANADNGEMIPSARIIYTYNDNGQMVREDTYWADELDAPFYYVLKSYNSRGQLTKEVEYQQDWAVRDIYNMMGQILYDYNTDGTLAKRTSYYVANTAYPEESLTLSNSERYTFEDGDIVSFDLLSATGFVNSRITFTYDTSVSADRIYYPYTPENSISYIELCKHKRLTEDVWASDINTGELTFSHTFNYSYEENPDGIHQAIGDNRPMTLNYNGQSRELNVNGAAIGANVRVVNAAGQTVKMTDVNADSRIDLSGLAAGTYIAVMHKPGCSPTAQKFIVR